MHMEHFEYFSTSMTKFIAFIHSYWDNIFLEKQHVPSGKLKKQKHIHIYVEHHIL